MAAVSRVEAAIMSQAIRRTEAAGATAGRDDVLDPAGRRAAGRGWMRQYLRSSVHSRLAELDSLTRAELRSLEAEEEPAP